MINIVDTCSEDALEQRIRLQAETCSHEGRNKNCQLREDQIEGLGKIEAELANYCLINN